MANRSYVFTINNPTGLLDFDALSAHVRYLVYQEEVGSNGTHHFQGYLELLKPMRIAALHKLTGLETAFFAIRRGTRQQAIDYSTKRDETFIDGPYEFGDRAAGGQGTRNDYATLKKLLDSGKTDKEIWDEVPDLYLKHANLLPKVRMFSVPRRTWKTRVYVLWGPTNLGKSYWIRQESPDAYWKQRNNWWDNYDGKSDVVLDDFYGWIKFDELLRLCDENPMQVEIKGSHVDFGAKRIFISSNHDPRTWYSAKCHFPAFARRVDIWMHWTGFKEYTEMVKLPEDKDIAGFDKP